MPVKPYSPKLDVFPKTQACELAEALHAVDTRNLITFEYHSVIHKDIQYKDIKTCNFTFVGDSYNTRIEFDRPYSSWKDKVYLNCPTRYNNHSARKYNNVDLFIQRIYEWYDLSDHEKFKKDYDKIVEKEVLEKLESRFPYAKHFTTSMNNNGLLRDVVVHFHNNDAIEFLIRVDYKSKTYTLKLWNIRPSKESLQKIVENLY